MTAKRIVITGASDGIGAAAARQLSAMGHQVVLVGRSEEKTRRLAAELNAPYHLADYFRLSDVVRLAGELAAYDRIDVLCNNAGGALNARGLTEDGFEKTFQLNVLGSFLLTRLLKDKLLADGATVIQTSSIASNLFGKHFDVTDLNTERDYSPTKAYGNAKLQNIIFTRELHKRYGEQGLKTVAFEPGIARTNFASESVRFLNIAYHTPLKYLFTITPERSARRLVRLAAGEPGKDFTCGSTYSYRRPFRVWLRDEDGTIGARWWQQCEDWLAKY